jgi:hypothetical protein
MASSLLVLLCALCVFAASVLAQSDVLIGLTNKGGQRLGVFFPGKGASYPHNSARACQLTCVFE